MVTHAGTAAGVGWAFSHVSLSVCLKLNGKWLELLTPNLGHIYTIVVVRHASTQGSQGQGHTVTKTVTVASDVCCHGHVLLQPAWVCMSIGLPVCSSLIL